MDIRRSLTQVAQNVVSVAAANPIVAEAADIELSVIDARIRSGEASVADLLNAGGFFGVPASRFMEGVA